MCKNWVKLGLNIITDRLPDIFVFYFLRLTLHQEPAQGPYFEAQMGRHWCRDFVQDHTAGWKN